MEYYDYIEFYNSPMAVLTPEEEYEEWAANNCPDPTEEEIGIMYEEFKQNGGK